MTHFYCIDCKVDASQSKNVKYWSDPKFKQINYIDSVPIVKWIESEVSRMNTIEKIWKTKDQILIFTNI